MKINVIDTTNGLNSSTTEIPQGAMTEITMFSPRIPWKFPRVLSSGDIIRIHRVSMNERGCFVSMNKFGSAVVVDLETDERKSTYMFEQHEAREFQTCDLLMVTGSEVLLFVMHHTRAHNHVYNIFEDIKRSYINRSKTLEHYTQRLSNKQQKQKHRYEFEVPMDRRR